MRNPLRTPGPLLPRAHKSLISRKTGAEVPLTGLSLITHAKINGVPDLVVEILSPSTAANDTVLKKQLYERTGVAEYWIADRDNQRLEQYRLVEGSYRLEPPANPVTTFAGGLCVKLDAIW